MRKILLDGKVVETLVPESLPMLIHGQEGSGASLYTVCLAAKWFLQGYKILYLCGYPMAEEAFAKEVNRPYLNAKFFTQNQVDQFITEIKNNFEANTIVIVKNIDLFHLDIFQLIKDIPHVIISGDLSKVNFKNELLQKKFTTEVLFSPLDNKELPQLEKFHGHVISGDYRGITNLE